MDMKEENSNKNSKNFFSNLFKSKKSTAITACALAGVVTLGIVIPVVSCKGPENQGPQGQKHDPETRPFVMSLGTPDGVFNPFFSTSAYDGSVIGMTQISMLSADKNGVVTYGDNEPVVVKDYTESYDAASDTTTYKFILKNGIKFSDGTPLTMKDVLFNLYTYLDPAYTGSSTIYSTKIQGLAEYRTQNPNATEGSMSSFEDSFYAEADQHIDDLIDFVIMNNMSPNDDEDASKTTFSEDEKVGFKADYDKVKAEFAKELESDWNTSASSKESYKDWGFTETWQIFLLNDGGVSELLQKDPTGKLIKDEDGNYKLDADASDDYYEYYLDWLDENEKQVSETTKKEWAMDYVFASYFPENWVTTNSKQFRQVIKGWATATTMRDYFATQAKSEYFQSTGKKVPYVTGIDGTGKTTKDFSGKDLGAEHEVLTIKIDGVDPKAIWNFGFTVAPMHYYSTTNYEGKDYIASFNPAAGEFGLEFGDFNFMQTVINAPSKVGLPVGAGVYKAASNNSDEFFNNNMVYYERNPYYTTLGSGIENAKIKYLRYKVVESDQIINALANGDIDFGDPNATQENIGILDGKGVAHKEVYTNGYGYVGINSRFIPDVVVRRAIIKAMDKSIIKNNYYKGGLADIIERPMSNTSYYYPDDAKVYTSLGTDNGGIGKPVSYSYDALGNDIENMIIEAGYQKNANGIYTKNLAGFGTVTLDYTFTIAGASKDHPAMAMFENAASILNKHGFKIKVVTSQTALSDLATGKLTVWAAAWSSGIDPDMYQVYHIDSLASSTSNWGYKQIKAGSTTEAYADEFGLITTLSQYIDAGRGTTVKEERKEIYSTALDLIMELAVEMPTYQRKDMSAWNSSVLNENSMTPEKDLTPLNGLLARLWELNYD